ncbi:MAG: hypothetical protein AB1467_03100 [Candidatus Diapherotrites archaeon]
MKEIVRKLRPIIKGKKFKGSHRYRALRHTTTRELQLLISSGQKRPESKGKRKMPGQFTEEFLKEMQEKGIPVDYDRLIKKGKKK